ncbi:MAG: CZB domain-containing protein [Pseudomonadota bacterium]
MSILDWFKQVTTGDQSADLMNQNLTFGENEEQFHGLNMREALDAHMAWTRRLENKLTGKSNESLDVATVASDCECTLGKWLHGTAKQAFGDSAEYEELLKEHADFHLCAGEILNNVINGEEESAQGNLKKLRYQSGVVQLSLVRLYSHTRH